MKEKIKNQKGFIRIPLLIVILSFIILASAAITGGVLIKQGNFKSTANISESFEQGQTISFSSTTEPTSTEPTVEELKQETIYPEEISTLEEIITSTESVLSPQFSATSSSSSAQQAQQIEEIQRLIDQLNMEQVRLNAEQVRQERCIEADNLEKQIQTLCHAYYFPGVNRCIEIRQKDIEDLKNYVPNEIQIAEGQDLNYYAARIQEEQDKVDQMISLKPQYESAKTDCGQ